MSKNLFYNVLFWLAVVAVAILWVLSIALPKPNAIEGFNTNWAILILSAICGAGLILNGLFRKDVGLLKKLKIYIGAGMFVISLFMLVNIFAIKNDLIVPIICAIVAVAGLLSILAVGGKKWDQGDNHNVGYKNYYERKAEEEKAEREKNQQK